ncbi:MAG TPA: hypothetical protein VFV34_09530 [Blastocatellia bacterium]|nr:hypothetical protein [Blastocatellia bacterium]
MYTVVDAGDTFRRPVEGSDARRRGLLTQYLTLIAISAIATLADAIPNSIAILTELRAISSQRQFQVGKGACSSRLPDRKT